MFVKGEARPRKEEKPTRLTGVRQCGGLSNPRKVFQEMQRDEIRS